MSHELNLFIFYKDHDYFFQKIRPLLACKLQKSLIDKFLLSESLEEYFDTWTFLNSLEQVLVIIYSYSQKSSKAKTFAEYLSNYVEVWFIKRFLILLKLIKNNPPLLLPCLVLLYLPCLQLLLWLYLVCLIHVLIPVHYSQQMALLYHR